MKRRGFTLIELLAVIIILGILMLIAIPSVTSYINNSRKETYVDTIKEVLRGATVLVNSGDLEINDPDATYYIPVSAISLENGESKSPYGKFEPAYIAVTYNDDDYDYYFVGRDESSMGIRNLTKDENIDRNSIESGVDTISIDTGIGTRSKIVIMKEDGSGVDRTTTASKKINEANGVLIEKVCRRATSLHTAKCNSGAQCVSAVGSGNNVTYGKLGEGINLEPGDAFDCDVNGDGEFNAETERFYLIDSSDGKARLIFYNNYKNGSPDPFGTEMYAGDADSIAVLPSLMNNPEYYRHSNRIGPVTGYKKLPSAKEWSNPMLIPAGVRPIKDQSNRTIVNFDYKDKVARFLTYNEVMTACNTTNIYKNKNSLFGCTFLLENTTYDFDNSGRREDDIWLEGPDTGWERVAMLLSVYNMYVTCAETDYRFGIRPVIEVYLSDMDY